MSRSFLLLMLGAAVLIGIADYVASDELRQFFEPRINVVLLENGTRVQTYLPEAAWCTDSRILRVFGSTWWERATWCQLNDRQPTTAALPVYEVVGWIVLWLVLAMAAVVVVPLSVLLSGVFLIMYYGMRGDSYLWAGIGAVWQLVALVWLQRTLFADQEALLSEGTLGASDEAAQSPSRPTWGDRTLSALERSVHWLEHSQWANGWRYHAIVVTAVLIYMYVKFWH